MNGDGDGLSGVPRELAFVGVERVPQLTGVEADEIERPFSDRDDFLYTGQLIDNPEAAVYRLTIHPETSIAITLDKPSYPRIGIESALRLLRSVPDLRLIKRLLIVDGRHREEPWIWQTTGRRHVVQAEAFSNGQIRLYRPTVDQKLDAVMQHEWCHLLRFASPRESALFDGVQLVEPLDTSNFLGDTSGAWSISPDELWSAFGETLLEPGGTMAMMAYSYPVRAAIWGRALDARLASLPPAMRSHRHDSYVGLVRWLSGTVRDEAIGNLKKKATEDPDANAAQAASALISQL